MNLFQTWMKICLPWTKRNFDKIISLSAGYEYSFRSGSTTPRCGSKANCRGGEETICTSIIVAAELRFGAEKSGSSKLEDQVDLILSAINILPLESPADREYGKLRHYLSRNGMLIGPNDLLIAAQALCAGLIVVTANTGEFSRVPDLKFENWLSE